MRKIGISPAVIDVLIFDFHNQGLGGPSVEEFGGICDNPDNKLVTCYNAMCIRTGWVCHGNVAG